MRWNHHLQAPAVLVASTDDTPFWLTTHVGDNGNLLVQGPSRMGKSGLVGISIAYGFATPGRALPF